MDPYDALQLLQDLNSKSVMHVLFRQSTLKSDCFKLICQKTQKYANEFELLVILITANFINIAIAFHIIELLFIVAHKVIAIFK